MPLDEFIYYEFYRNGCVAMQKHSLMVCTVYSKQQQYKSVYCELFSQSVSQERIKPKVDSTTYMYCIYYTKSMQNKILKLPRVFLLHYIFGHKHKHFQLYNSLASKNYRKHKRMNTKTKETNTHYTLTHSLLENSMKKSNSAI